MGFKMSVSNEALEGREVIPAGLYKFRFVSFAPKRSALKPGEAEGTITSLNYNAKLEIIDNPDLAGRYHFEGLNEKAAWILQDFSHALGIPLETDGKTSWFAGEWDGDQNDPKTWVYKGPLTGQVGEIEIGLDSYNGKPKNVTVRYICRIADCAAKFPKLTHSKNLQKKA